MITSKCTLFVISMSVVLCSFNERLSGWLDRVVEYQKKSFVDDLMKTSKKLKFSARLDKAPPGYVDSKAWDFESVVRLLTLIRDSEGAAPVRRIFRRAFNTNRRDWPWDELQLNSLNDDYECGEYNAEPIPPKGFEHLKEIGSGVIVIANPVEAKLPSARISVALLKSILQNRAAAAREMPTTALNISWPVTPKRNLPTPPSVSTDAEAASSASTTPTSVSTGADEESSASTDSPSTPTSVSTDAESSASTDSPTEVANATSPTNGTVVAANETAVEDVPDTNKTAEEYATDTNKTAT